ncbi:ABC transporter ATP-binding protein [Microbacterium sp. RG1]|uniref:ABC transporter ATP-binding protein n=1 Tax=Microbacterium sp. RG1 TaxID=2489212 RepID=UPI0010CA55BD|nr:ATP-binding cassette domain-containing protein [Microbacterium sp. RG1]QCQ16609.1 ABC transporter ATP-binding protein [Microbacterium sp. RG1]
MSTSPTALNVQHLAVEYPKRLRNPARRVIDDVSFSIPVGRTLALVGESGSGKSTIGKAILGLAPITAGSIVLGSRDITTLPLRRRREVASQLQAVFQNPFGSLNPALTIAQSLAEPIRAIEAVSAAEIRSRCAEVIERVGLPVDALRRYPAEFSGGQRQRIAIARAAVMRPGVIVCDEPTSALDVTTQAKVLTLLADLQSSLGVSYLFITHDLAVVREFAHQTMVLDGGRIVESGETVSLCDRPQHPYTQALVAAAPVPDPVVQRRRREERLRRQEEDAA